MRWARHVTLMGDRRWARHVTLMGDRRGIDRVLVGGPEEKKSTCKT